MSAGGSRVLVAAAPKEDFIFGWSSADEAIAAYQTKNP
jgi:hypothetical protein